AYFLENINKSEKEKEILLRLSEGEHRLSISYVAPAPSWKMCYRIEIPDEVEIKQFRIYGFCIIENTLEEDLENVELSVVAGMPISFIYKLYHSHIPERMVVEEEDRTIQAPIDFEGRLEREMEPPEPKKAMYRTAGVMPPPSASPADYAIDDSFEEMDEDEVGAGLEDYSVDNYSSNISGKAKAEFFEFKFSEPVSIGRGKSSMVPLFSKEGEYKKDLIFNYSKLSDNPVFTLRFENFSGFTLESGPVTIMEGKDYSGEAIIRLSPPESEIILAYAIDTTVNILREVKTIETFDSIQLKKQYLCTNYYEVLETTYTAENKDSKDKKILIEQTRTTGMKLFDSPEPEEETLKEYRFGFSIQKKSKASLKIRERVLRERKVYLDNLDKQVAEKLYKTKKLDKSILEILKPLFTIKSDIYELEKKIQNLDKEIASAMKSQDNVRKNISTLKDSGEEGTYRKAQVKELMLGEEKIKEYEKEKESIKKEKDALLIKKQNWLNNLK
ncbi:MAG: hypothetical protein KDK45_06920, partial [Leptospiraceae bacterium]|nr:hypothetical protein [Leptospiraceae bacterium]